MANTTTEEELGYRPIPVDEYDSYLLHVKSLIESEAPVQDIRAYLDVVEREYLMLSSPDGSKDEFIRAVQEASAASG